jgi:hypothetical protein
LQIDFGLVRQIALAMPEVEEVSPAPRRSRPRGSAASAGRLRERESPVLKLRGSFMAAIAVHPSAEPDTLVVRSPYEERDLLIEDAPDTYYITDYYRPYPLVLVRLAHVSRDALHDLLSVSWRLTAEKTRPRGRSRGRRTPDR